MGRATVAAAVSAALAAGGVAVGRMLNAQRRSGWPRVDGDAPDLARWQVVTVCRAPEELAPGGALPEPLARLGDAIEVHLGTAPGGRGTELAARLRGGEPQALPGLAAHVTADDPRIAIRAALRAAKQQAETGELLRPGRSTP